MLALSAGCAHAAVIPFLGTAQQFAVLGGQSVTNTGTTVLHGDLGVAAGPVVSGASSIVFAGGARHENDAAAREAQSGARAAYDRLAALCAGIVLSGQDLGNLTLLSGVYRFASSAGLTGALTIDFANEPHGVVVFQIGSTLTTSAGSVVNVINGTSSNGIYFQVGSSATLGAASAFAGNILALQNVTFGTAASIGCGRALASTVTMDSNRISNDCSAWSPTGITSDYGSRGYSGFGAASLPPGEVPEPATPALFGLGLCAVASLRLRRRQSNDWGQV
jgi:type VI secretion system secreted protein VgrG